MAKKYLHVKIVAKIRLLCFISRKKSSRSETRDVVWDSSLTGRLNGKGKSSNVSP